MRHESERSRRRREVREGFRQSGSAAQGGDAVRRALSAEQAVEFFQRIDAKDAPAFGLVKMAALDLDTPHVPPVRKQERGGCLADWAPAVTLLAYAAHRRLDGIVAALLRAGADPSARWSCAAPGDRATTPGVQAYAASLRNAYGVWVVRQVVAMRRTGALAVAAGDSTAANAAARCLVCSNTGTELLAWGDCGHRVCEPCFWAAQMAHDHVACGGAEAGCPGCPVAGAAPAGWLGPASASSAAERAERQTLSQQKWNVLAATETDALAQEAAAASRATGQRKAKKSRIRAMPEREAAALSPGWLRSDRVERLNEAACADDVLRVLGILEAGVDIDGTGECGTGETAALSAAMLGNAETLRLLGWAGATLTIPDHAGATPISAAVARGHEDAAAVIRDFMDETQATWMLPPVLEAAASPPPSPYFHSLIDTPDDSDQLAHPGSGSGFADHGFSSGWLTRLESLWAGLPSRMADTAAGNTSTKSYTQTCATRSLFCDAEGWVESELAPLAEQLLRHTSGGSATGTELTVKVLPRMRFLCYRMQGGSMQPQ